MSNREEETIELESQPLNAEKKAELFSSPKSDQKEKITPIGLTKEELMKFAQDPFWCKLRKILFTLFWLLWLSMFVGAFLIIHMVPSCPATSRLKWYQKEPTAQINLKVFNDQFKWLANEENIGPFMNTFQAKTLLLPNIFNSSEKTNEILNHFQLNTRYGSQEELSRAIQNLKVNHETNVIMDLNAATTDRQHPWFILFMANEEKYRDFYLIADPNYPSYFGYETEKLSGRGQLITKNGQPLLNLLNPDVQVEFKTIFEKWGRLNIKGYRLLGAPYLLVDPDTKKVVKSVELNQRLIKDWTKELKKSVSDGVFILQLDDQDADSYREYFGTQDEPIADIVVNKFVTRLSLQNSTNDIRTKLEEIINGTKAWNDELSNIGPWTGWLTDDLNESRNKDDLLICFSNILAYILPRGLPITRLSTNLLHIGIPEVFFKALREEFNNIEKFGTYDNARIFSKLSSLRKNHADAILLGRTEFVNVRNVDAGDQLNNDVFAMIRANDKHGLILIANLKNGPKRVKLDLNFNTHPRTAEVAASCKIKEGHLMLSKIQLDEPINLAINETLIATFDLTN